MKRSRIIGAAFAVGLVLAACGGSAVTPVPAKPESSPIAASPATTGMVLLDITGSGNHQSNPFTVPKNWDIAWEAEPAPNVISGAMILIDTYNARTGNPVSDTIAGNLDNRKSGIIHMNRTGPVYTGAVYLNIRADDGGTWHVKAVTT